MPICIIFPTFLNFKKSFVYPKISNKLKINSIKLDKNISISIIIYLLLPNCITHKLYYHCVIELIFKWSKNNLKILIKNLSKKPHSCSLAFWIKILNHYMIKSCIYLAAKKNSPLKKNLSHHPHPHNKITNKKFFNHISNVLIIFQCNNNKQMIIIIKDKK